MSDLLFQRTSKRTLAGTLLVWLTDLSVTNRLTGWDGSLIVWSMDSSAMVEALAALGQPTRHDIYRLLARAPEGLPAGEIARHLMSLQTRYLPTWEFYRVPTWSPRAVRENR